MKKLTRREFLKNAGAAALTGALGWELSACAPAPIPAAGTGAQLNTPTHAPATPSPVAAPLTSTGPSMHLRILFTNDLHGHLRPLYHREDHDAQYLDAHGIARGSVEAYLGSAVDFADLAKQYGKVGGVAQLATLIKQERASAPERTLLLDAGDAWYGSALALLTQGKAPVEVMNAIGYDAMTMHWEFNLGKEALLERIGEAKFPILAQNLVDTDFEDRVLEPSLVKEVQGLKLGIVGQAYPFSLLTTEARDANPGWRMGYREDELQKEINRLRKEEGAQLIILLSHMGLEQDKVMAGVLQGVDVMIGSHTHDILWKPEQIGQTIITQSGSHGKLLGELDLEIRDGKVVGFTHNLIPVLAERVAPDAEIDALIEKWYAPHRERLLRVVGETRSLLYRRSLFGGTSDAIVTQAYRDIAGADVGCAPGWRFGATLLPGTMTVEDVYNAFKPTATPLYTAKLSGRQIRASLEDNLDNIFNADPLQRLGGDVLRCAGVKADLRAQKARNERLDNIRINDAAWQESSKYLVGTSGGRTQYMDEAAKPSAEPAVELLVRYIEQHSPLSAEPLTTFTKLES